jgi:hypothetical protein
LIGADSTESAPGVKLLVEEVTQEMPGTVQEADGLGPAKALCYEVAIHLHAVARAVLVKLNRRTMAPTGSNVVEDTKRGLYAFSHDQLLSQKVSTLYT